MPYVRSQWMDHKDPYAGDLINVYNDGPSAPGDCASHRSCFEPSDELPQRRAPLA